MGKRIRRRHACAQELIAINSKLEKSSGDEQRRIESAEGGYGFLASHDTKSFEQRREYDRGSRSAVGASESEKA